MGRSVSIGADWTVPTSRTNGRSRRELRELHEVRGGLPGVVEG